MKRTSKHIVRTQSLEAAWDVLRKMGAIPKWLNNEVKPLSVAISRTNDVYDLDGSTTKQIKLTFTTNGYQKCHIVYVTEQLLKKLALCHLLG